mgnify:CR=1 FL=1
MSIMRCNLVIFRAFHILCHIFHLVRREDDIGVDADERGLGTYHSKSSRLTSPSASKIITIHAVGQVII